jgi:small nuclear ribonucleoprotein (snRNP)-like protein
MSFLAMCIMSSTVTVRTTNGSLYEGLFHTYQTVGKELNIVLKHAKTLQMEGKPVEERARKPIFLIRGRHLAELKAKEVHLNGQDISAVALRESSQFEDSSVAGKDAQHRELQAFVFDKTPAQGLEEWDAEPTGWTGDDMFKQNADKFGVETTFDMDQYTVALRDDGTGVSAAEAARIEREILASHANDAHTREERGMLDDSGMSEEDRYGAVLRAAPGEAQPQLRVRPQPQQARGTNANAAETPARNKAWPGSSWGRETGRTGGTRGPTEERVDINRMRQTLAEGKKDLKKAVDREKQAQYTNNVSAVDALNLNPGLGSTRFRPDTKPDVAHQLLHYKSKRESAGAPNTLASAAATPVAGGAATQLSLAQGRCSYGAGTAQKPSRATTLPDKAPARSKPKCMCFVRRFPSNPPKRLLPLSPSLNERLCSP